MNMSSYVIDERGKLKLKTEIFSNQILLQLEALAKLNKILSDFTKLKIIYLLNLGELNVTQIVNELKASQSLISHHLATLRREKIVTSKRVSKIVYYSLSPFGKSILEKYAS